MIHFWILFQTRFAVPSDKNGPQSLLLDIEEMIANPFLLNFYSKKSKIIQNLKHIETKEVSSAELFRLYKTLENKTKKRIDTFSAKTNLFRKNCRKLKKKLELFTKRKPSLKSLDEKTRQFIKNENSHSRKLFRLLTSRATRFVKLLQQLEQSFAARQQLLRLDEDARKDYDRNMETLKDEATEYLENVSTTWEAILVCKNTEETNLYMKQRILLEAKYCWEFFKQDLAVKNNKKNGLASFNYCFYLETAKLLKKSLNFRANPLNPFSSLTNVFRLTPIETEKGDIFQQLENLDTLRYFGLDRRIEKSEEDFFLSVTLSFGSLNVDYKFLSLLCSRLARLQYKVFVLSCAKEEDEVNLFLILLEKVLKLETFLANATNKPDFLVVRLERGRQLLSKIKEVMSVRSDLVFSKDYDLLPAFEKQELQDHPYLSSSKRLSLGEKLANVLSETETVRAELLPFEFSLAVLKSAVARYEYYLTFPFLLSEDEESIVTPERGVNKYCRAVFTRNKKVDWDPVFCSEETESFPLILWAKSTSFSIRKQPSSQKKDKSLGKIERNTLLNHAILVLIIPFLVLGLIAIWSRKNELFRNHHRRKFTNRQN